MSELSGHSGVNAMTFALCILCSANSSGEWSSPRLRSGAAGWFSLSDGHHGRGGWKVKL